MTAPASQYIFSQWRGHRQRSSQGCEMGEKEHSSRASLHPPPPRLTTPGFQFSPNLSFPRQFSQHLLLSSSTVYFCLLLWYETKIMDSEFRIRLCFLPMQKHVERKWSSTSQILGGHHTSVYQFIKMISLYTQLQPRQTPFPKNALWPVEVVSCDICMEKGTTRVRGEWAS